MKKRVLFIQGGIGISGISKALVTLLNSWDTEHYAVDLLLIDYIGPLREYIPTDIQIIEDRKCRLLFLGKEGIPELLKSFRIDLALISIFRLFCSFLSRPLGAWVLSRFYPRITECYDLIVDWQGQQQLYYMVDKLIAKKKVSVFHSDYNKWSYYYRYDKYYYEKVDAIFSISEECVESLKQWFPSCISKIGLLSNIVSWNSINSLASQSVNDMDFDGIKLLSIGHISIEKGCHWSIQAASILKNKGYNFKWYFVGTVLDKTFFSELVKTHNVADRICFLGKKVNPYPYIKSSTIIVHSSQFEGKSVALDEAKLFAKPIVVTAFSTVYNQFQNGVNASIVEMSPSSIAAAIEELINNADLQNRYIKNLTNNRSSNENEVEKLYGLIDSE